VCVQELLQSVFVFYQYITLNIHPQLFHFCHNSVHETIIDINQPLLPFPIFKIGDEEVISILIQNNSGAFGIV
jgi:hypothetical protein